MAKKFKVGCRYQVKPECYGMFDFNFGFWEDKPKDFVFTIVGYSHLTVVAECGRIVATTDSRWCCKRIKD
jgi:hypothetical protein